MLSRVSGSIHTNNPVLKINDKNESEVQKYYITEEIVLDYSYPLNVNQDERDIATTFSDYDLFSLRTKLECFLHRINPCLYLQFFPKEYNGRMHMCVQLFEGSRFQPINAEFKAQIDEFLDSVDDSYCLLFSDDKSIKFDGICLSSHWLTTILPYVKFSKHSSYYENGALYVLLSEYKYYSDIYYRLNRQLCETFVALYRRGTISLHPHHDATLIANWELVSYPGNMIPSGIELSSSTEMKLYQASWVNNLFAPDITAFLFKRYHSVSTQSRYIMLDVGIEVLARHFVADRLLKHDFIFNFYDDKVVVRCNDLVTANKAAYQVTKALARRQGIVTITTPSSEPLSDRDIIYDDQIYGLVLSRLVMI